VLLTDPFLPDHPTKPSAGRFRAVIIFKTMNGGSIMFNRRDVLQTGLAAAGYLAAASRSARAQAKPLIKVRYSEVNHAVNFAPVYVAVGKGSLVA
jgi:hypothetical protein